MEKISPRFCFFVCFLFLFVCLFVLSLYTLVFFSHRNRIYYFPLGPSLITLYKRQLLVFCLTQKSNCLSYFSIDVIKHHDQGNLRKGLFLLGLWFQGDERVHHSHGREARQQASMVTGTASWKLAHVYNHKQRAERRGEHTGNGKRLWNLKMPPSENGHSGSINSDGKLVTPRLNWYSKQIY